MAYQDPLTPMLRRAVNRRLTLNLLIQGAAAHGCWTAHHLVADSLSAIDPKLPEIYDRVGPQLNLAYWRGLLPLVAGRPGRFWKRLHRTQNVFRFHPFMLAHGKSLAGRAKDTALKRCRDKGLSVNGILNEINLVRLLIKTIDRENDRHYQLEQLACEACHQIYQVPIDRLDASLTLEPKWGDIREPETRVGRIMMAGMVGWGGVDRRDGALAVVAKAMVWPLLIHELIKGTVELICLHGLNQMDEESYLATMDVTEHVEHEVPMLQVGPEIFARLLAVAPRELPIAQTLMHIAMMQPEILEKFMFDMIETPNRATETVRKLERA